jgi:hypothetical protein
LDTIDTPEVRAFLVEEAYAPRGFVSVTARKLAAIKALTALDRDAAFRACEVGLCTDSIDRELFPLTLLSIDQPRAIPVLFAASVIRQPTLVAWAIGRALRRAHNVQEVAACINKMLKSETPHERGVGVSIASWQLGTKWTHVIQIIAMDDPEIDVRRAAEKAVARFKQHESSAELLEALNRAQGLRAWSYLDALAHICDPWLLGCRDDVLWIGNALENKAPGMHQRASDLIKDRMEQLKKDAETQDRKNSQK